MKTIKFLIILISLIPLASFSAEISLLVAYTENAKTAKSDFTGSAGMIAFVEKGIGYLNDAFQASGSPHRVRLIHIMETSYVETTISNDISSLRTGSGALAEIHTIRDWIGADLVMLLIGSSSGGGLAYIPRATDTLVKNSNETAFSVLNVNTKSYDSLAHELSHNLGFAHDTANYTTGGRRYFCFSHGYRFTTSSGQQRRTIAASSGNGGIHWPRVRRISDHNTTYNGAPVGQPAYGPSGPICGNANNAQTLVATAGLVSQYRNEYFFKDSIIENSLFLRSTSWFGLFNVKEWNSGWFWHEHFGWCSLPNGNLSNFSFWSDNYSAWVSASNGTPRWAHVSGHGWVNW